MRELPILMHARSVRGIMAGSKTQTRRPVKHHLLFPPKEAEHHGEAKWRFRHGVIFEDLCCPYGQPGDRLYVRETWQADMSQETVRAFDHSFPMLWHQTPEPWRVPKNVEVAWYRADGRRLHVVDGRPEPRLESTEPPLARLIEETDGFKWLPSIHMPRWASRILLEVTEVRVERVQDISPGDIAAEGVAPPLIAGQDFCIDGELWPPGVEKVRAAWRQLWDSTNAHRPEFSWANNPWVWAVSFRRVER